MADYTEFTGGGEKRADKKMPKWFWYVAAGVGVLGIIVYLRNKAANTGAEQSAMQSVLPTQGSASSSGTTTSGTDVTGLSAAMKSGFSDVTAGFTQQTANLAAAVTGIGAGLTQVEADLKSYIDQQTASINSGMAGISSSLSTNFTQILANQKAIQTAQSSAATQSSVNVETGLGFFNNVKSDLGGYNTTEQWFQSNAPDCMKSGSPDWGCIGAQVISGGLSFQGR